MANMRWLQVAAAACAICPCIEAQTGAAAPADQHVAIAKKADATPHDGAHDFDFEIGTWKTHLKRLKHPLSGSAEWVEYDGTSVVTPIWGGRANLVELNADGPAGQLSALSLRLYDPQARQWSLNFANAAGGTVGTPTIGEFHDGRGEFYDTESFNGRSILLRFVISDITKDSCRFEQAFSTDGGRTWEVNWIATDTRAGTAPQSSEKN